jgi:hypothetical protein
MEIKGEEKRGGRGEARGLAEGQSGMAARIEALVPPVYP